MILPSVTGTRYAEHENLNSYRNYPFSETADLRDGSGSRIASDVFTDAMLYPVVTEARRLRLSVLDCASGEVAVTDGETVVSGSESDGSVELYDAYGRHAGTIVCGPGWDRERQSGRRREFDGLWFAPQAECPVVHSGVMGLADEGRTWRTTRRDIVLRGDGNITPVLSDTESGPVLRFDAQYEPPASGRRLVRQILFATAGQTMFEISESGEDSAVELSMSEMDREDVCWHAHLGDDVAVVADACSGGGQEPCGPVFVGVKADEVRVCPSDIGNIEIIADDAVGFKNPVKVSAVEGGAVAPRPQIVGGMSQEDIFAEASKMLQRPVTVGNGVRIGIPGVNHGW